MQQQKTTTEISHLKQQKLQINLSLCINPIVHCKTLIEKIGFQGI